MKVGFIGLGIMGSRMAHNLMQAGYDLIVYNRTESKAQPLVGQGAQLAESPRQVGAQADILFTMLATPAAVEQTALGEEGFLDAMRSGSLWVDESTVNPSFTRVMAAAARERGVRFIDAPVSGTKDPAEKGELLIYAGGDKQDVEEVRPLLEVLGRKVLYTGENGMATSMKMVVNLMLGESMLAFAEALLLGEALGLSQEMLFETLVGGPVTAPFLGLKVDKIKTGDYEADFPLQWLVKDLHLATLSGYEQEVPLPAASAAQQIFALAKQKGFAGEDFSAIYAFLKENGAK